MYNQPLYKPFFQWKTLKGISNIGKPFFRSSNECKLPEINLLLHVAKNPTFSGTSVWTTGKRFISLQRVQYPWWFFTEKRVDCTYQRIFHRSTDMRGLFIYGTFHQCSLSYEFVCETNRIMWQYRNQSSTKWAYLLMTSSLVFWSNMQMTFKADGGIFYEILNCKIYRWIRNEVLSKCDNYIWTEEFHFEISNEV